MFSPKSLSHLKTKTLRCAVGQILHIEDDFSKSSVVLSGHVSGFRSFTHCDVRFPVTVEGLRLLRVLPRPSTPSGRPVQSCPDASVLPTDPGPTSWRSSVETRRWYEAPDLGAGPGGLPPVLGTSSNVAGCHTSPWGSREYSPHPCGRAPPLSRLCGKVHLRPQPSCHTHPTPVPFGLLPCRPRRRATPFPRLRHSSHHPSPHVQGAEDGRTGTSSSRPGTRPYPVRCHQGSRSRADRGPQTPKEGLGVRV